MIRILRDLKSKTGFAIARAALTRTGKFRQRSFLISSADARVIFGVQAGVHPSESSYRHPLRRGGDLAMVQQQHYARLGESPIKPDFIEFSGDPE